ncbi:hypothetical protein EMMF5_003678 [Cystobasidiomycetes sp. EMM_F5]
MSEATSPQKRSVEDVTAAETADESKRSKADAKSGNDDDAAPEAGPSEGQEVEDDDNIDEDELAALDTANIISGPRTRGKKIDFRKASEEAGGEDEDDEEDADVTANTTMPKSDEESEEEEEEEVEVEGDDAAGESAKKAE